MYNTNIIMLTNKELTLVNIALRELVVHKNDIANNIKGYFDETVADIKEDVKRIEELNEKLERPSSFDYNLREDAVNLRELSKDDLISMILNLREDNANLREKNEELECDLQNTKDLDNMTTIEVASYFTSYENIQRRYDANDVPYQMKSVEDLAKVFGLRFESIQGFYDLSQEDKEIFKNGIVKFLNGFGLGNRVPYLPTKVWKENNEFRFLTLEGRARQQFMNKKGEVY